MLSTADHYRLVAPSLPKIFVNLKNDDPMVGTGICIAPGVILTCAHVILGEPRLGDVPAGELQDWKGFYERNVSSLMVIDQSGQEHPCSIESCYPDLDVAILLTTPFAASALTLDPAGELSPGQDILYYGYPYTIQNAERDWPLSIFRATVSAQTEACVGGSERRMFSVVHGLALGGTSGGPVFDAANGTLCGMINGLMQWSTYDVLINEKNEDGTHKLADTDTPLPVTFATPFAFLQRRGITLT